MNRAGCWAVALVLSLAMFAAGVLVADARGDAETVPAGIPVRSAVEHGCTTERTLP